MLADSKLMTLEFMFWVGWIPIDDYMYAFQKRLDFLRAKMEHSRRSVRFGYY